jgi:integrase
MGVFKIGATYYADFYVGKGANRKRVREAVGTSKREAETYLGKVRALKRENRFFDVKKEYNHTFDDLLERYKETFKEQKYYKDKQYYFPPLKSYFSGRLLAEITPYELEKFRNKRKATPVKTSTERRERSVADVNRILSTLRHMFSKAVEWEMIERSPFTKIKNLFYKENNMRLRFLSEHEERRLVRNCTGHLKPIVITALNTGMRRSEILSLQWKQVRNGFIYLHRTKTDEARQVPINETLARLFQSLPRHITSDYKSFKTAVKRSGIQDFRFHDLRHVFASKLASKGASLKALQELLGHKNIKMTMRYAHLADNVKKDVVRLLDGVSKDESTHKVDKKS